MKTTSNYQVLTKLLAAPVNQYRKRQKQKNDKDRKIRHEIFENEEK